MNYDGGDWLGCLMGGANGTNANLNMTFDSLIISCTWQGDNSTANLTGVVGEIAYLNTSWTNCQVTETISLFEHYTGMIGYLEMNYSTFYNISIAGSIKDGYLCSGAVIAQYNGINTTFALNMTLLTITVAISQCSGGQRAGIASYLSWAVTTIANLSMTNTNIFNSYDEAVILAYMNLATVTIKNSAITTKMAFNISAVGTNGFFVSYTSAGTSTLVISSVAAKLWLYNETDVGLYIGLIGTGITTIVNVTNFSINVTLSCYTLL